MKNLPWMLIALAVVIVSVMTAVALILLSGDRESNEASKSTVNDLLDKQSENSCGLPSASSIASSAVIEVNEQGFNPSEVSVKVGQTVQWKNNGSQLHRIVGGVHPAHDQCVGLSSEQLEAGQEFRFTFTKPGEWEFHDEVSVNQGGVVVVTE